MKATPPFNNKISQSLHFKQGTLFILSPTHAQRGPLIVPPLSLITLASDVPKPLNRPHRNFITVLPQLSHILPSFTLRQAAIKSRATGKTNGQRSISGSALQILKGWSGSTKIGQQ